MDGIQFPTDPMMDQFLSSVCVCVCRCVRVRVRVRVRGCVCVCVMSACVVRV